MKTAIKFSFDEDEDESKLLRLVHSDSVYYTLLSIKNKLKAGYNQKAVTLTQAVYLLDSIKELVEKDLFSEEF